MKSLVERETQLISRLNELQLRMQDVERTLDQKPEANWDENAVVHEDDEVLERLGVSSLTESRAINAALKRIAQGTYGDCVKCGDEISAERLDLIPHTPLCRKCAH